MPGNALGQSPTSLSVLGILAAARRAAAVFAFVAAAVGGHEHAAFGAVRRVVLPRNDAASLVDDSILRENHIVRRLRVIDLLRIDGSRTRNQINPGRDLPVEIISGDELPAEPAANVVDDGLGIANLLVASVAGRLEAGIAELVHESAQRHAILQRNGNG